MRPNAEMSKLRPWITFAGVVLVAFVLSWAKAVLVPIALAALLTFVLSPAVTGLERWIGRVPAVLLTVTLVFTGIGFAGWAFSRQIPPLAEDLPRYRDAIHEKLVEVRGEGRKGPLERLRRTVGEIADDFGLEPPPKSATVPVAVPVERSSPLPRWLDPLLEPLGTAVVVFGLVIFMLLERRDLRDRLLGLFGRGHVALTTKAFDEAGRRVSRQLLIQTLINLFYGTAAGTGLYLLDVPYAGLWGALAGVLRFIPYVGPFTGAIAPILVSLGALPGWTGPLIVAGLFLALELFTNLVLETWLYAGAAGVSQVALLVSVVFWAWLWGPLGLLMATPLTVCLVVLGKHVPGLEAVGVLISDTHVVAPDHLYYQRLLAHDQHEAAELIERFLRSDSPAAVYDQVLLPALNYAELDRIEGRLTAEEEGDVIAATRELIGDTAQLARRLGEGAESPADPPPPVARPPVPVLGYAINGAHDAAALEMLAQLLAGLPFELTNVADRLQASELVSMVREGGFAAVCFADLPPSSPAKSRYLVSRLRAALPELPIVVGRWAPEPLADESGEALSETGASRVSSTLLDTRGFLAALLEVPSAEPTPRDEPAAAGANR